MRLPLISWILIPFLGAWVAVNYLVGFFHQPLWTNSEVVLPEVLSSQTKNNNKIKNNPNFDWKGEGLVTFWFDDGWYSHYSVAYPLLEKKQFRGALAIATGLVGGDDYLTWPQIKKLSAKGWEITSHSRNHICEASKLNLKTIEEELSNGRQDLEKQGLPAEHFVTPCGIGLAEITQVAKKYFLSLRTSGAGINPLPVREPYRILVVSVGRNTSTGEITNWLSLAKKEKGWLVLMFHQIEKDGGDYSVSLERFKKIVSLVTESGLAVVLPSQALQIAN